MSGAVRAAVLIPARNEVSSIQRCLEHVLSQDLGLEQLEVIVVDGNSDDGTGEIAEAVLRESELARWVVHRNDNGSTPSNLNVGLRLVQAPVVCRVDARSLIPCDYVRRSVEVLESRRDIAVVGGAQRAVPRSASSRDVGIARALNNRFGMGMSRYRRGARSGPSDTVYLGSFRTGTLREAGGWDERFLTNQDFELNRRMARYGVVWFDDALEVGYVPRASLAQLFHQYRRFGRWKAKYWRVTGDRPQPRQLAMVTAPVGVAAIGIVGVRRCPRTALGLAVIGVATLESTGSSSPSSPSLRARGVAVLALGSVAAGWWSGVVEGVVRPSRGQTQLDPSG
jgi:succinoglycan biosynthesis protein ExoA